MNNMFNGLLSFDQYLSSCDLTSLETGQYNFLDSAFDSSGLSTTNYDANVILMVSTE